MAKKKSEFPGTLYVARQWERNGENPYFVADADIDVHADLGGDTRVAVYQLIEVVTVKVKIESIPD